MSVYCGNKLASSVLGILMSPVVIDPECITIGTAFGKQVPLFYSFSCAKHSLSCLCRNCLSACWLYVTLKRTQSRYILENTRDPIEGFSPYCRQ